MRVKYLSLLFLASILFLNNASANTILPLYGNHVSRAVYGGDAKYGEIQWSAANGVANFSVTVDPGFIIYGVSFNTNIPSSDFALNLPTGWTYRGLNTAEGIGTDRFDYSIYTDPYPPTGSTISNTLQFAVQGANITQDSDFFRPNLLPKSPVAWDSLLHQSHFGVYVNPGIDRMLLSDIYHEGPYGPAPALPLPPTVSLLGSAILGLIGFSYTRRRKQSAYQNNTLGFC